MMCLRVQTGKTSFAELEKYVLEKGEAQRTSGKQEKFEQLFNQYV
jgi:xylose isomerase